MKRQISMIGAFVWVLFLGIGCTDSSSSFPIDSSNAAKSPQTAHPYITPDDIFLFKKGVHMDEILQRVNFRGNFEVMYEDTNKDEVVIISYELLINDEVANVLWAVFINRKFDKFVNWERAEREEYPYDGTTATRLVKLSAGNVDRAVKAVKNPPVNIEKLLADQSNQKIEKRSYDWGLTLALLPIGPIIAAKLDKEFKANIEFRRKFNGALLHLGQERTSVEKLFGKPIKCVKKKDAMVCWYGADKHFDLLPTVHFSTVVVVYRSGLVNVVYGGGFDDAISEIQKGSPGTAFLTKQE